MAHLDNIVPIAIELALNILEMGNAVNPILLHPLSLSLVIIKLCVENRCKPLHSFIKALSQGVGAERERLL